MPVKRFELSAEIKAVTPVTDVQIVEDAGGIRLSFSIYIKGKVLPTPPPSPDPEETTHRDIEMTASNNLYLAAQSVRFAASPGTKNPKITLIAAIEGKIPGTGAFKRLFDDDVAATLVECQAEEDTVSQKR